MQRSVVWRAAATQSSTFWSNNGRPLRGHQSIVLDALLPGGRHPAKHVEKDPAVVATSIGMFQATTVGGCFCVRVQGVLAIADGGRPVATGMRWALVSALFPEPAAAYQTAWIVDGGRVSSSPGALSPKHGRRMREKSHRAPLLACSIRSIDGLLLLTLRPPDPHPHPLPPSSTQHVPTRCARSSIKSPSRPFTRLGFPRMTFAASSVGARPRQKFPGQLLTRRKLHRRTQTCLNPRPLPLLRGMPVRGTHGGIRAAPSCAASSSSSCSSSSRALDTTAADRTLRL